MFSVVRAALRFSRSFLDMRVFCCDFRRYVALYEKMFVEPPEMFVLPPGCFLPLRKYLKGVQNWQATHLYPSFATGWDAAT